ncbi:MAG TPA: glucoamylase family protein [Rhizomicrobium sp.]|nr:glucoamylase family protein [Rhizomicrobium sp.]
MHELSPVALASLPDEALLEALQRRTFHFFWEGAEPESGLARDRNRESADAADHLVAVGGSGFGIMAMIVAVSRGWITRDAAVARLERMLAALERAERHHGVFPHFLDGVTGATIPFGPQDDGGDLVETSFLMMGLLTARSWLDQPADAGLRARITTLWESVEWDWHVQPGQAVLTWHWSPRHGFAMNHAIRGWNECLITYVLAAACPTHGIGREIYEQGFCQGPDYRNGNSYYGIRLPLGPALGGPLFFTHYSFCGLNPRGLRDAHADYWEQNVAQARINHAHCLANPGGFAGYGPDCWGVTASDDPDGYDAHAPGNDNGTISPTAALSSFAYMPQEAFGALRGFLQNQGTRIWGRYGFTDAFNPGRDWFADTFLAIDQGPIVVMIENYRSGLLWKLFMSVPEVRAGLARLGFETVSA